MKKLLMVVLGPMLLVAVVAIGVVWWDRGAPPGFRPEVVDVTPDDITWNHRGVRLRGTANYAVRLTQKSSRGDRTWYLFPVMPLGDTMSRHVRVVVRTERAPDPMLGFEDVEIEGIARPPGAVIGPDVREALIQAGFELDEKLVLVEAFDD
ncbi:MAG: hypothetical protein D6798_12715 [Deltaproteobacteria bacterium]|nr:MAG: hypothetical protein D6798_12715 [Deltaproteobacteria bacterium]